MEPTWLALALIVTGQGACIAGAIGFSRAHPNSRYPFWSRPIGQSLRSTLLVAFGTSLSLGGGLLIALSVENRWLLAVIVIAAFVPFLVTITALNMRAADRQRALDLHDVETPSLIQQRLALGRIRVRAFLATCVGAVGVLLGVVLFMNGGSSSSFPTGAVFIGYLTFGIGEFIRYRREVRTFEARHGADAGVQ